MVELGLGAVKNSNKEVNVGFEVEHAALLAQGKLVPGPGASASSSSAETATSAVNANVGAPPADVVAQAQAILHNYKMSAAPGAGVGQSLSPLREYILG